MVIQVTILILIDGFLQFVVVRIGSDDLSVTILILIDGFLQSNTATKTKFIRFVTILILIDGFLQCKRRYIYIVSSISHNPYFNRWFSAIKYQI